MNKFSFNRGIGVLVFLVWGGISTLLYSQSEDMWNLVWREDFGVAEDTVIKDFPDASNAVPGHCFISDERYCTGTLKWNPATNKDECDAPMSCRLRADVGNPQCGFIDDGFYGIANNTYWAYNRPEECKINKGYFVAGKDHTGNKNGAMLIINSGAGEGDLIFSKKIEFNLCDSREYRFVIYVASITSYGKDDPSDPSGGNADLEMNVVNVTTNKTVESIRTGPIPYWTYGGYGGDDAHSSLTARRKWSEFSCEFTAKNGDVLELQVVNWGDALYNDFVIDDISLYRKDTEEIPDPIISTNTLASSTTALDACRYMAAFQVPDDVLPMWKKIYDNVYFLWQKSEDDGLTWQNVMDVSGIDKTAVEIEVNKDIPTVYRVIITGGSTEALAESQALEVALTGATTDGCAYYSISNTLAGVSPTPDCSFREDARVVWLEDFGVIDSFSTRPYDGSPLNYYEPFDINKVDGLEKGDYVITSAPDSSIKKTYWESWSNKWSVSNPYTGDKSFADASGKPNGAMMYIYYGKADADDTKNVLFEKSVPGPFCKCKSFVFSFEYYDPNEWAGEKLKVMVLNDAGGVVGESELSIGHDESRKWGRHLTPFTLPMDYTGGVRLVIANATPSNDWNTLGLDNLQISVCGESAPRGSVKIDDNPSIAFLSGFECGEEPAHKVSINDASEWLKKFPNYGFAWQYSLDGVLWQYLSDADFVEYESEDAELINYRAVFAETKEAAVQAAKNGMPDDECVIFGFSNSVALKCKDVGCKAPVFEIDGEDTVSICNNQAERLVFVAKQTNKANVDKMQWYSSPFGRNVWTPVANAITETLKVLPADSTDYLFIAVNDTCFSDSVFVRVNVYSMPDVELSADADSVCLNDEVTLSQVSSNATELKWYFLQEGETSPVEISDEFIADLKYSPVETGSYYVEVPELVCPAVKSNEVSVVVQKPLDFDFDAVKPELCAGETVVLNATATGGEYYLSQWKKNGVVFSDELSVEDDPSETVEYAFVAESRKCSVFEKTFNVKVEVSAALTVSADKPKVCEGDDIALTATFSTAQFLEWQYSLDNKNFVKFSDERVADKTFSQMAGVDKYYFRMKETGTGICPVAYSSTIEVDVEKRLVLDTLENKVLCAGSDLFYELNIGNVPADDYVFTWTYNNIVDTDAKLSLSKTDLQEDAVVSVKVESSVCPQIDLSAVVKVQKPVDLVLLADKVNVCAGDDVALTSNTDNSAVLWRSLKDGVASAEDVASVSGLSAIVNPVASTKYWLEYPGDAVCTTSVVSDTVKVFAEVMNVVSLGSVPSAICFGDELTINAVHEAGSSADYSWTKNNAPLTETGLTLVDTPTEKSVYSFTVKGTYCKDVVETVTVDVERNAELKLSADKSGLCKGEPFALTADYGNSNNILWEKSVDGKNFDAFSNDLVPVQSLVGEQTASYRLASAGSGVCKSFYSEVVVVEVEEPLVFTLSDVLPLVCEGTEVSLAAEILSGSQNSYTYKWTGKTDFTEGERSVVDVPAEKTVYKFVASGKYCPETADSVVVDVEKPAELNLNASDTIICAGTSVDLAADFGGSVDVSWESSSNGFDFAEMDNSLINSRIETPVANVYYRLKSKGQACAEVFSNVVGVEVEEPISVSLTEDELICPHTSTSVVASVGGSPVKYLWESKTDGVFVEMTDVTGKSANVLPEVTTTYRLTVFGKVCNSDSDEAVVSVDEIPELSLSVDKDEVCMGEEVSLTADFPLGSNLTWFVKKKNADFVQVGYGMNTFVGVPEDNVVYKVSALSKAGCKAGDVTKSVVVHQPVDVSVEGGMLCEGDSITLSARGLNKFTEILWTGGDVPLGGEKRITVMPEETTIYSVLVRNGLCEGQAEAEVRVVAAPKIVSFAEIDNKTYEVVAESELDPLYYDFGNGFTSSAVLSKIRYGHTYNITVSDEIGCKSDTVFVVPTFELNIPTAFTPDGDGIDDVFEIENISKYPDAKVRIYDRFGKSLVDATGEEFQSWDGSYNGVPLPSTDYWYEIYIHEINKEYIGHFTLLRK